MSSDPRTIRSQFAFWLFGCLVASAAVVCFLIIVAVVIGWAARVEKERYDKDRWEKQVAELQSGQTTTLVSPDPKSLEALVRSQPEIAAKITAMDASMDTLPDERLQCVNQLPHLEIIVFDEAYNTADPFLKRIAGKESITELSFYQTYLGDEAMNTVAGFPNLKRLEVVESKFNLAILRSHKTLEVLKLSSFPKTKQEIDILVSMPKLSKLIFETDDNVSASELAKLQKALPKVEISGIPTGR